MVTILDRIKKLEQRRQALIARVAPSALAVAARIGHLIDPLRAPFPAGIPRDRRTARICELIQIAKARAHETNLLELGGFA